jgi:hypothetical protein
VRWLSEKLKWVWNHKTKVLGLAAIAVGYVQNNLAQVGHLIPLAWQGAVLGFFGVLAFAIGLYNTFAKPDPT